MSNIFNKALEEMDKHLDEILEALPDDYFRIGDKNAQRIERIYES